MTTDRMLADAEIPARRHAESRHPWTPPAVTALSKLTDLTLTSPIGGGGGIGGGGSTVF